METEHEFPVSLELRIDWSELDIFNHVNNVMYFKYIQAARVNYWETIGLGGMISEDGIGPMLASTGCQFRKPLFYPGKVTIRSRIEFIKTTSFGIHHVLVNEKDEIVAEAHDVVVMYNFKKAEKTPFPESLKLKVEQLEGKKFQN